MKAMVLHLAFRYYFIIISLILDMKHIVNYYLQQGDITAIVECLSNISEAV